MEIAENKITKTTINRKLNTIGQNKSAVLESAVGRKPVGNIMLKFRQNLQNAIRNKIQVEGNKKVYQQLLKISREAVKY